MVLARWSVYVRGFHTTARHLAKGKKSKGADAKRQLLPPGWEAVIGIECHAQLLAPTKLFSATPPPALHDAPNTHVAPFDAGFPGTLPCLQHGAVTAAIKAALALRCHIEPRSFFDRKHYFYADLPAAYQITQKRKPFAHSGTVSIRFEDGYLASPDDALDVPIEQLQLEQDTAKSTYVATDADAHVTLLDYSRAGVALVEIVSAPVFRSSEQAGAYVRKLRQLLRCVGASDGNMNEGSLRCDANVSIHKIGEPFGARCEIKNLNSVKFMMHALDYEIERQYAQISAGKSIVQETRGFDEARGTTHSLRRKEDAVDYRFMPEANVGPLLITKAQVEEVRASLPELPDARHERLRSQYHLSVRDVNVLTRLNAEDDAAGPCLVPRLDGWEYKSDAVDFFEALVRLECAPQVAANWTIHLLPKHLGAAGVPFCHNPIPPVVIAELIHLLSEEMITQSTAQSILRDMVQTSSFPHRHGQLCLREWIREQGWQRRGIEELRPLCQSIIDSFPDEVAAIQNGKTKVMMRLVGEAMRKGQGRADPEQITALLHDLVVAKA